MSGDNGTDLLGGGNLSTFTEHASNQAPQHEHYTFTRVDGVDVKDGHARVTDEREQVTEEFRHVVFEPNASHCTAKFYVGLANIQLYAMVME